MENQSLYGKAVKSSKLSKFGPNFICEKAGFLTNSGANAKNADVCLNSKFPKLILAGPNLKWEGSVR